MTERANDRKRKYTRWREYIKGDMMGTIITTVGTSLLSNAKRDLKKSELNDDDLSNYARHTDAEKTSAETNSLSRLIQNNNNINIIFLHSQTEDGERCAKILANHYQKNKNIKKVRLQKVDNLDYKHSQFKMRGLRSLVATLIGLIREERKDGEKVCINATGGFKAEIAYATLVGLLFDVPVYYIHEVFKDIIEMPPTPISWDYSVLADSEEFFEWIFEKKRTTEEVDKQLRNLPQDIHVLLAEEGGQTFLSPAGEAFYEAYIDKIQEAESIPIWLSAQAYKTYEADEGLKLQFDRLLSRIRVPLLRRSGSHNIHNSDCLVYPSGHRPQRLIYFLKEQDEVYVCEMTHNHEIYEKILKQGVSCNNYADFHVWQNRKEV
jgi:putative CRISPR-associated protein (TIGR02619 family)